MARAPLILDRYEPIGTAGAGGFGTVQIAWDPRIQRKVAIKTIQLSETDVARAKLPGADAILGQGTCHPDPDPSATSLADSFDNPFANPHANAAANASDASHTPRTGFAQVTSLSHVPGLDEARTAAMLQDARIVTVFDFEIRGLTAYLIMEYVEGITLTKLLSRHGDELTLDMIAAVFDAVAGALGVAHKAGVLHLDIKPDNILINAEGQAKVTDFGLATLADASGAGTTGGGTIGYMPLEQMRRQPLDARTDEWSLASLTYEMLVGECPFRARDLAEAERAIEGAELIVPSLCWDDIDEQIDDVLFYALDPDPDRRYASVADFAEEVDKFLGDAQEGTLELAGIVARELHPAPSGQHAPGEGVAGGAGESFSENGRARGERRRSGGMFTRFGAGGFLSGLRARRRGTGRADGNSVAEASGRADDAIARAAAAPSHGTQAARMTQTPGHPERSWSQFAANEHHNPAYPGSPGAGWHQHAAGESPFPEHAKPDARTAPSDPSSLEDTRHQQAAGGQESPFLEHAKPNARTAPSDPGSLEDSRHQQAAGGYAALGRVPYGDRVDDMRAGRDLSVASEGSSGGRSASRRERGLRSRVAAASAGGPFGLFARRDASDPGGANDEQGAYAHNAGRRALGSPGDAFGSASDAPAEYEPREPLPERIPPRVKAVAARVYAAVASGIFAAFGLVNITFFDTWFGSGAAYVIGAAVAVVALAGAAVPHVGALVSCVLLGVALLSCGHPLVGLVMVAASVAWWFFIGRRGIAEANVLLALPVTGAIGGASAVPFAAGASLRLVPALATCGLAALLSCVLASLGSFTLVGWNAPVNWHFATMDTDITANLVRLASQPATWATLAGWLAGAAACSLAGRLGSRPVRVAAVAVAVASVLTGTLVFATPTPDLFITVILAASTLLTLA